MMTRAATALTAMLIFIGAQTPAFAAGPLSSEDRLTPDKLGWVVAEPGKNPLTAREASAVLAFIHLCLNRGQIEKENIRYDLLGIDTRAGGSDPAEFAKGGDLFLMFSAFSKQFHDRHPGRTYWSTACNMNPYIEN